VEVCRRLEHDNLPMVRSDDAAVVPRRHGPRPDGAGANRFASRGAGVCLRGKPSGRQAQETAVSKNWRHGLPS
jgi:hypothetical protein